MNKQIFSFFLFIIILTAIEDVFIGVNDENRIIVVVTQLVGVLLGFIAFIRYLKQKSVFVFNSWFTTFILLLTFYAIFSNNFFTQFPRVLYSVLPFYIFFNAAKYGDITEKKLQFFAVIMIIVSVYQLYIGYFERQELYGDLMNVADNIAYQLLSVMVVVAVLKPKLINLILISIVYLAIMFSLKRGAMVSATILFIFYFLEIRRTSKNKISYLKILGSASFLIIIPSLIRTYSELLFYRFIIDESGGSSRTTMYTEIFSDWLDFTLFNKIIGNGFFSIGDGTTYAHSDWFQLLHDHGVLGIIIFIGVFVSLFNVRKYIRIYCIKYYLPFLGIFLVLFLKSIYSGTYMTKFDAISYGVIGLVLGTTYYNKTKS